MDTNINPPLSPQITAELAEIRARRIEFSKNEYVPPSTVSILVGSLSISAAILIPFAMVLFHLF